MPKNKKSKTSVSLARGKPKNGTVLDFNPNSRVEFITGFRKRKNERRKIAEKSLIESEREKRILQRKEIREELQRKRNEKRDLRQTIQSQSQDNRIFFAGETKDITEILQVPNIDKPSKSTKIEKTGLGSTTDYHVNNQVVSVVTKSLDFSQEAEFDESAFAPLREESSEEEEMIEEEEDTRIAIDMYEWHEDLDSSGWKRVKAPTKPTSCKNLDELKGITLNVWCSDKWKKERSKGLLQLLGQYKADFVCLQEVSLMLLHELSNNHWIREYYCISDAMGEQYLSNLSRDFGQVILLKKGIAKESLVHVRVLEFSKSISKRSAIFLSLKNLVIVNLHLEGLNNEKTRMNQLEAVLSLVESDNNVIIMGDFGAMKSELNRHTELFEKMEFGDLWQDLSVEEEGWTFDQTVISDMIPSKQRKKKTQARFDRILLKSDVWRGQQIRIIGKDPIPEFNEKIYISTHFAVEAKFTTQPSMLLAAPVETT